MHYTLTIQVQDSDIDELGHASNIAYIRWLQDVAVAHSTSVGLGWKAYLELGAVFVIRRQEVDYLRPALRGDTLELRTWICNVAAAKVQRETEFKRVSDGVLVAKSLTTWGFVETTQGRPSRIPDQVRVAFGFPARPRRSAADDPHVVVAEGAPRGQDGDGA